MRHDTLPIGSVSSGTMREADLIPAFLGEAESLRLTRDERRLVREIHRRYNQADQEEASYDLEELFDLLGNCTPDYCYFGSHPGDGADYGVWPVEDLLSDTRQGSYDGCVWRSDRLPGENREETREAISQHSTHWLQVNDHGNATLYRLAGRRWVECWSIV